MGIINKLIKKKKKELGIYSKTQKTDQSIRWFYDKTRTTLVILKVDEIRIKLLCYVFSK